MGVATGDHDKLAGLVSKSRVIHLNLDPVTHFGFILNLALHSTRLNFYLLSHTQSISQRL